MILPLARSSDPVWKQKFSNISKITPEIKKQVSDMKETLEITGGVGLAAPQVKKPLRAFIIDYSKLNEAFLNPKILRYGKETNEIEEGCLSVPCVRGIVNRPTEIEIEYLDLKGNRKKKVLSGYHARIAQHEYDHLSSTFFINRVLDKKKIYTYPRIKIVFFGTPEFGSIILRSLYGQHIVGEYNLQLVVTSPDKPADRGREVQPSEVKKVATQFGLRVETPPTLKVSKLAKLLKNLRDLAPDFIVLASYGRILPKEILEIPKKAPLNVHPSLLPKYRGASPIQSVILNGETYTGVTIMKMAEKMDAGAILGSIKVRIGKKDTTESLSKKLAEAGSRLIHHVIHLSSLGKIKPVPQDHKKANYTKILKKEDGYIDWENLPTGRQDHLEKMIRAYYPWPGVWTHYPSSKLKAQSAKVLKLLPNRMVQLEGKEPVGLKEFKVGHPDFTLEW